MQCRALGEMKDAQRDPGGGESAQVWDMRAEEHRGLGDLCHAQLHSSLCR